mmetsp:Transcript_12047/g.36286  ORF Transcript_12047/g.36286 Transcript_12047/m.36286 type:complete len:256 (+) Transcript_12047:453-1220(+)
MPRRRRHLVEERSGDVGAGVDRQRHAASHFPKREHGHEAGVDIFSKFRGESPSLSRAAERARGRRKEASEDARSRDGVFAGRDVLSRVALRRDETAKVCGDLHAVLAHVDCHGLRLVHRGLDASRRRRRGLSGRGVNSQIRRRHGPRLFRHDPSRRHDLRLLSHHLPQAPTRRSHSRQLFHRLRRRRMHRRLSDTVRRLRRQSDPHHVPRRFRHRLLLQKRSHRTLPTARASLSQRTEKLRGGQVTGFAERALGR